jgi:hypothetical protein
LPVPVYVADTDGAVAGDDHVGMVVPDPCTGGLRELEDFLQAGYNQYTRDDYEREAAQRLDSLRAGCPARAARLATVLVERSLGRLGTAEAVAALSDPSVLGDETDALALKALVYCAKLSLGDPAEPTRHRVFRRRGLALAELLDDSLERAKILTNWLFAELAEGQLDEAERLRCEVGPFVETFVAAAPKEREIKARYLAHCAKLALRRGAVDASHSSSDPLADASTRYAAAIDLVRTQEHVRVNLQIEYAEQVVAYALAAEQAPLQIASDALERAHRAQDVHSCDGCRAYFHDAKAGFHELAATRAYNRDRAEAVREWKAAIVEWRTCVDQFEKERHHLAEPQRDKLARAEQTLARIMQPQKIFLSHSGADKPRIRELKAALSDLGFEPWLDEDAMSAGTPLERALVAGMAESCAAVFYLTANFRDERYLQTEIDYALQEARTNDDFKVIVLRLADVAVPPVLARFVHKDVDSGLDALRKILAALPICVGTVRWRRSP